MPRLAWICALAGIGLLAAGLWLSLAAPDAKQRRPLMVMSALPIGLGNQSIGELVSDDAAAPMLGRWLGHYYEIRFLDTLTTETLKGGASLLLAQPRRLLPEELVALDNWVRAGGRVLILDDPELRWEGAIASGAPQVSMLDPLLTHWGIRLELGNEDRESAQRWGLGSGHWAALKPECGVTEDKALAFCRIGKGRADLIADADWIDPANWMAGDNPLHPGLHSSDKGAELIDRIDGLAGQGNRRVVDSVQTSHDRGRALVLVGLLVLLLSILYAGTQWTMKRRSKLL